MKCALVMAMVNAAMLNSTCGTLGRILVFHTHCVTVATAPKAKVSGKLNCETPMRMNRKFRDIVPVSPGSRTFNVEATKASKK